MASKSNKKTQRISKSAARRHTAQVNALVAETPAPLPSSQANFLAHFKPQNVAENQLPEVLAAVRAVMERSGHITGLARFRQHTSDVAALAAWVLATKGNLDWRHLMSHAVIHNFTRFGGGARVEATSAERMRRLRNLASQINPGSDAPPLPKPSGHRSIQAPYTAREDDSIFNIALSQPSPINRRQLCAIVGLSRGAGVAGDELRPLRVENITDLDVDGIDVTIGSEPDRRIVPVRRHYEELVRIGVTGLAPGQLLIGQIENRQNVANRVIDRAKILSGSPEISVARLRTSWIAELMREELPIAVILAAAGLRSARTLTELIPYLHPETHTDVERHRLQGDLSWL